ncbi:MAG: MFS transporter [Flavobacteriales bacterium]|nr:MFS transporter [Flavobacteriales bacterium]
MTTASEAKSTNYPALVTLITVFFFWGFIAAGNSVFIPFCKFYFALDQFQSQLVDFAFYLSYFLGALGITWVSSLQGKDLISSWGYQGTIVRGLWLSAFGALVMIGMLLLRSYAGILTGLFVVGLGFSLQQTAAQPLAIALGDGSTGAARISLGGGINSFGTAVGPLVVSLALFGSPGALSDEAIQGLSLLKVVALYLVVGALFAVAALLFHFSRHIPREYQESVLVDKVASRVALGLALPVLLLFSVVLATYHPIVERLLNQVQAWREWARFLPLILVLVWIFGFVLWYLPRTIPSEGYRQALAFPQLRWGMLAIFVYVGVEVSIVSNLGELLRQKNYGGLKVSEIAPIVTLYWGSLMMGRWAGAVAVFPLNKWRQRVFTAIMPILAFIAVLITIHLSGSNWRDFLSYWPFPLLLSFIFWASDHKPARMLILLSLTGALLTFWFLSEARPEARWYIVATGLMCSVLWPCIFNLAVTDLGPATPQGSAYLIMMILGGAIIPPLQGKLADLLRVYGWGSEAGIRYSYLLDLVGFAFLAFCGWVLSETLRHSKLHRSTPL